MPDAPFVTEASARAFADRLIDDERLYGMLIGMTGERHLMDRNAYSRIASVLRAVAPHLDPEGARPGVERVATDLLEAAKGRIFYGSASVTEYRIGQIDVLYSTRGEWGALMCASSGYPSRTLLVGSPTLATLRTQALAEIEKLRRPGDHPSDVEQTTTDGVGSPALNAALGAVALCKQKPPPDSRPAKRNPR